MFVLYIYAMCDACYGGDSAQQSIEANEWAKRVGFCVECAIKLNPKDEPNKYNGGGCQGGHNN